MAAVALVSIVIAVLTVGVRPVAANAQGLAGLCQFSEFASGPPGGHYLYYEGDMACPYGAVFGSGSVSLINGSGQYVSNGSTGSGSDFHVQGQYTGPSLVAGVPTDTSTDQFTFAAEITSPEEVWLAGPDPSCAGVGTPELSCTMNLTFPYSHTTGTASPPTLSLSAAFGTVM